MIALIGGTGGLGSQLEDKNLIVGYGSSDLDVTNTQDVNVLMPELCRRHTQGMVYMAVKNVDSMVHKVSPDDLQKQLDVNIIGLSNVLGSYLRYHRETNTPGCFVYVSSVLAVRSVRGTGIYRSCKSFGESLIQSAAVENASKNIRCNVLRLGYFQGGLTNKVPNKLLEQVIQDTPTNRLGNSTDLFDSIMYVTECQQLTGAIIDVSGGLHCA